MFFKRSQKIKARNCHVTVYLILTVLAFSGLTLFVKKRLNQLPRLNLISEIQTRHSPVSQYIVIESIAFSADGSLIASGGRDGSVEILDISNSKLLHDLKSSQAPVTCLVFGSKSYELAVGTAASSMIWDARKGTKISSLNSGSFCTRNVFLPNSTKVLVRYGSEFGSWDYKSNIFDKIVEIGGNTWNLAVSPDFAILATSKWPERVALHDLRTENLLRNLPSPVRPTSGGIPWAITCLAFSSDNKTLFVGGGKRGMQGSLNRKNNGYIQIWNVKTGTLTKTLIEEPNVVFITVSPNGMFLASADDDGEVVVRSTRNWQIEGKYSTSVYGARTLVFSPNSQILAGAGLGNKILLWKIRSTNAS